MRVLTDNREQLPHLKYVYLANSPADKQARKLKLKALRFNKAYALLTLDGYTSREDAEQLRDKTVMIDMEQATPLRRRAILSL